MHILLVEPAYYTQYPPLGLLKLATYHRAKGDTVELIRGCSTANSRPDRLYISSLFTYAWQPVHEAVRFYSAEYQQAMVTVGGIYASLCRDHLEQTFGDRIEVHEGLVPEIEELLPDYSLVPEWRASILFSSRGCIRKCPFCSVPQLEPKFEAKKSIKHLIYPGHRKAILWDNNILASPYWQNIFGELEDLGLEVDFNQGLDARLLTEETVSKLKKLRIPIVRLAYDSKGVKESLKKAIGLLKDVGIDGRRIVVYCLYGHLDTPEDFVERVRELITWGVVAYPMRYQPLEPCTKDSYIPESWTGDKLEMVAKARRVMGYGGAFPPYDGLRKKFIKAKSFEEAFALRPRKDGRNGHGAKATASTTAPMASGITKTVF
jgi:hypothetical protein